MTHSPTPLSVLKELVEAKRALDRAPYGAYPRYAAAFEAAEAMIASAPQPTPVARLQAMDSPEGKRLGLFSVVILDRERCADDMPLYAAPPQGVMLTDEEMADALGFHAWLKPQEQHLTFEVGTHDPRTCVTQRGRQLAVGIQEMFARKNGLVLSKNASPVRAGDAVQPQQPTSVHFDSSLNEGRRHEAWISVEDRLPDLGTECLVWCREYVPGFGPYAKVDTWDEQREAPVGWSSATIPIGPGWNDSDFENVLYWQPITPPAALAQPSPATAG